jgi:ABC-type nickel/cobalt efflux system permease component RcnA
MTSVLFLGLLIGMQHALEADHIAAVASIATRQKTTRRIVAHGAVWGIGHTVTLMVLAGGAFLLGKSIEADIARWLETGVGVMLMVLGAAVLFRLGRERIHYHLHRHGDGLVHFHAHAHEPKAAHDHEAHDHDHPKGLPYRTLLVGMMHGMAGSAALLVLTASSVVEPEMALLYVALFGIGSIAGMAALSAAIAIPLTYTARALTWGHRFLQAGIGFGTLGLGVLVVLGR